MENGLTGKDLREYTDVKGRARYYKGDTLFLYKGRKYIVCNHWYEKQRVKFVRWLEEVVE